MKRNKIKIIKTSSRYFNVNDMIKETGIDYFYVPAKITYIDKSGQIKTGTFDIKVPFSAAIDLKSSDALYLKEEFGVRQLEWDLENFAENYESTILDYFRKQYDIKRIEQYEIFPEDIYFEKGTYEYLDKIKKETILEGSNKMKYFTIKDIIEETGIDYFLIDARIKFIDRWGVERESDTELDALLEEAVDFDEEFPATEEGIKEFRGRLSDYIHDNYDRFEDEVKDKYSGTAVEILDISIDTSPHLPREIRNYLNDLVGEIVEQKKRNIKIKSLSEARKKFFTAQDIIDNTGIDYFLVDARVEFVDRWDRRQESDTQIEVPFEDAVDLDKKFPATKRGVKEFKYRLGDYIHDNYDELEDKVRDEYYDAAEIIDISIDESPLLPGEVGDYLNDLVGEIVEQKKCICKGNIKMKSPKTIIERLLKLKELLLEANPAKGWSKVAPKTKSERESVKQRGGESCFLDPENLKFPVCRKTDAEFDCRGALAAYRRAKQYGHSSIAKKALNVAKRHGCDWAKEENKSKK